MAQLKDRAQPVPVRIVPQERSGMKQAATRLGTPAALLMLVGLLLIYIALQGWDRKYGTFNGAFAGKGSTPTGTKARYAPTSADASPASIPLASAAVATLPAQVTGDYSAAIMTLRRYIANLQAVPASQRTTKQNASLALYTQRLADYQARMNPAVKTV